VGGNAFAFVFDLGGRLVIVNAAFGNLSTYTVTGNGSLSLISAGASTNRSPRAGSRRSMAITSRANAGSDSLSQYTIGENGSVVLGNPLAATGTPGAVDMAASGQFRGSGSVRAFSVNEDGSLAPIGSWTVPDGGSQEGIAAA